MRAQKFQITPVIPVSIFSARASSILTERRLLAWCTNPCTHCKASPRVLVPRPPPRVRPVGSLGKCCARTEALQDWKRLGHPAGYTERRRSGLGLGRAPDSGSQGWGDILLWWETLTGGWQGGPMEEASQQ